MNIIDLRPDATNPLSLYQDGIRLYDRLNGRNMIFSCMDQIRVGKKKGVEFYISEKKISKIHAIFTPYNDYWLILDNDSANGTWLNGIRLKPFRYYLLHPDDEIDFAHKRKVVFFQTKKDSLTDNYGEEETRELLEKAIADFVVSGLNDDEAMKRIVASMLNLSLYVPVEVDTEKMELPVFSIKKEFIDERIENLNVKMKIRFLGTEDNKEILPLFTTHREAKKGPESLVVKIEPKDYIEKIVGLERDAIINPFGKYPFYVNQLWIKEILLPLFQKKQEESQVDHSTLELSKNARERLCCSQYQVIRKIKEGGLSDSYQVEEASGIKRFVKTIEKKSWDSVYRNALGIYTSIMDGLVHPSLAMPIDLFEDERYLYIILEYIDGIDLKEAVRKSEGALQEDKVVDYAVQIAEVVSYLHKRKPPIIVRDIKPSNIMIDKNNKVILTDMGIARRYIPGHKSDAILGTKGFAAPEQYDGIEDTRADIYSLGMTLYYMVTGCDPNDPQNDFQKILNEGKHISKKMKKIIVRCTQSNVDLRFQSMDEVITALNKLK